MSNDRFKFKFLLCKDGKKTISQEYTLDQLIEICDEDIILDDSRECDCTLNEGNPICEGDCQPDYEEEKIVGKVQYIGLKDKNDKLIFDNDLIEAEGFSNPSIFKIVFVEGAYGAIHPLKDDGYVLDMNHFYPSIGCRIKVIGNTHENPELLLKLMKEGNNEN